MEDDTCVTSPSPPGRSPTGRITTWPYAPSKKSRVTVVRTSERTSAAITEWPDKATRDAAELKIDEVRRSVKREDQTRMTGEMKGEIVADV